MSLCKLQAGIVAIIAATLYLQMQHPSQHLPYNILDCNIWWWSRSNGMLYLWKLQAGIVAIIAATLYLRTHIHDHTIQDGTLIQGFLFFSLLVMLFNGIAEMTFSVQPPQPL